MPKNNVGCLWHPLNRTMEPLIFGGGGMVQKKKFVWRVAEKKIVQGASKKKKNCSVNLTLKNSCFPSETMLYKEKFGQFCQKNNNFVHENPHHVPPQMIIGRPLSLFSSVGQPK